MRCFPDCSSLDAKDYSKVCTCLNKTLDLDRSPPPPTAILFHFYLVLVGIQDLKTVGLTWFSFLFSSIDFGMGTYTASTDDRSWPLPWPAGGSSWGITFRQNKLFSFSCRNQQMSTINNPQYWNFRIPKEKSGIPGSQNLKLDKWNGVKLIRIVRT